MKTKKVLLPFAILSMFLLSSCNKGVGCPNNFSLDTEVLEQLANLFVVVASIF